ncbi:MAG: hypothetical protein OHK0053_04730 [Microscillaceae bacterium]
MGNAEYYPEQKAKLKMLRNSDTENLFIQDPQLALYFSFLAFLFSVSLLGLLFSLLLPALYDLTFFFGLSLLASLVMGVVVNLRDKSRLRRQTYQKIHELFQV